MPKMAVFVEGLTEQLFVERLITEVAGAKAITLQRIDLRGQKRAVALTSVGQDERYVLIVNSGTDNRVASDVRDNYAGLSRAGYTSVVALRDVRPSAPSDIPQIVRLMHHRMPTKPISVEFILAVMEIEAWFLAEHTHFERIDVGLAHGVVCSVLGSDPNTDDMQSRPTPSNDLHDIYQTVGLAYRKKRNQLARTVEALDYAQVYCSLPAKLPPLARLVTSIDAFLAAA